MEEGHQKSKTLSYTAKFKCQVVQCKDEKGNCKATTIFGVDESNVQLWWEYKAVITKCEASQNKLSGTKKDNY
jgi:hypothetical protein